MIEVERVSEARDLEKQLAARIRLYGTPSPLIVPKGHTEWYRGALSILVARLDERRLEQEIVSQSLRPWLKHRLLVEADGLYHWTETLLGAGLEAEFSEFQSDAIFLYRKLRTALDAYSALDIDLAPRNNTQVLVWYSASMY